MESEIPRLYDDVHKAVRDDVTSASYFSCTSRNVSSFMSVTLQTINRNWDLKAWCLGCFEMLVDHTGNELEEAFSDMLEGWNLSERRLVAITTDNVSNNDKAFAHLTWMYCFGHNLDLSVSKALALEYVSSALSRLRKTIFKINKEKAVPNKETSGTRIAGYDTHS